MTSISPFDYSWNGFERKAFIDGKSETLSKRKIKIDDVPGKRNELVALLEKLPHKYLAKWSIENAQAYLPLIDIGDNKIKSEIITETSQILAKTIDGKSGAFELRKAGFLANTLSKKSLNDISKFSARVFAQAIASGHMRSHGIVSSDYAIKVVNMQWPNDRSKVASERDRQIELAKEIWHEFERGSH